MTDDRRRTEVSGVRSAVHIGGHPIHPILIPLPIGALTLLVASDIVAVAVGDPFWAEASWWLLWAGLVTGALAAVVGLVDWFSIERVRTHMEGKVHLGSTLTVLALTGANLAVRAGERTTVGGLELTLTLVTAAVLGVAGWYGGELSYRHGVGVTGH